MNDKKPDEYKVTWGSRKDVREILVHIALILCFAYAIYAFFYQEKTERYNAEKAKVEETEKEGQASRG